MSSAPSLFHSVVFPGMLCASIAAAWPAFAATPVRDTAVRRISAPQSMMPSGVATPVDRERRLREKAMSIGSPIFIRIFKAESELEVWMQKGDRFEHFATYPICYWSGRLGPKLREGDRQAPEGIYSVSAPQLHRHGRWPRALDIGFPNPLDRANKRTGSAILVHGGCSSIGCYAMTNPVMEEIFSFAEAAIDAGQDVIPIHVFPFRMTPANVAAQSAHPWSGFWSNLKEAYDMFEQTGRPPKVAVCGTRYLVQHPDADTAAPVAPRRMVKLARMMRGEWPVKPGECQEEPGPTPEMVAAASKFAHGLRGAEVPATPLATMPVPPQPVRAYRNVRANYASARKARVAAYGYGRRFAGRIR